MDSKLKQLQGYLEKYIETISSVLNIDIEIIDDKLMRIAGSGIYKKKVNESAITEGYIYNQVIETGKEVIVLDIGKNDICISCCNYSSCINKTIIAVPIKLDGKTLGAIGAVTIDKQKKKDIEKKIDSYLPFIENICDLISIKLEEAEIEKHNDKKLQMFHGIINYLGKGIVIIDCNSKVSYINEIAKTSFHLSRNVIGESLKIIEYKKTDDNKDIITLELNNNKFTVFASMMPVYPYIKSYDKILVFKKVIDEEIVQEYINSKWGVNKLDSIIGNSLVMNNIKNKIKKLAKSSSTVLITGESGTGKELIARAIHSEGRRHNKPFIAINCAAIPENLLESELFGYVKGAFSGASSSGKIGKFEIANEGVIFLDEIGDLSLHLQAKLLRVLQERKFARIGSNKLIDLDIKIIAATNKDLLRLVNEGKYRDDLYYRLNVIPISLPPLRERKEDLIDIMNVFIDKYVEELDIISWEIDEKVINMLDNYNWPGNIRELENAVEYMMNLVEEDGLVTVDMMPVDIINFYKSKEVESNRNNDTSNIYNMIDIKNDIDYEDEEIIPLKEFELMYIRKLIEKYGKSTKLKKQLANKLGIGLATLYRKLEEI